MDSPLDNGGFRNAPVTKTCFNVILFASCSAQFLLDPIKLTFTYGDIFVDFKIFRLFVSLHCFSRIYQAMFAALLLFKFRQIERMFGSRYFLVLIASYTTFATFSTVIVLLVLPDLRLDYGPTPALFAIFVPYFSIPVIGASQFRFVSNKTLTYLVGLQLAFFSNTSALGAFLGIIIGILVKYDVFWVRQLISNFVEKISFAADDVLVTDFSNFPATLEAQEIYSMEQFQRRMNMRYANRTTMQPDEQLISQLIDMGFTRELATEALRQNNNNFEQTIMNLLSTTSQPSPR